jgi:hypothetical protein
MASDEIGREPMDKEIATTSGPPMKQGELHQDVEVGLEMVDIDRIEKVYQ